MQLVFSQTGWCSYLYCFILFYLGVAVSHNLLSYQETFLSKNSLSTFLAISLNSPSPDLNIFWKIHRRISFNLADVLVLLCIHSSFLGWIPPQLHSLVVRKKSTQHMDCIRILQSWHNKTYCSSSYSSPGESFFGGPKQPEGRFVREKNFSPVSFLPSCYFLQNVHLSAVVLDLISLFFLFVSLFATKNVFEKLYFAVYARCLQTKVLPVVNKFCTGSTWSQIANLLEILGLTPHDFFFRGEADVFGVPVVGSGWLRCLTFQNVKIFEMSKFWHCFNVSVCFNSEVPCCKSGLLKISGHRKQKYFKRHFYS